MGFGQEAVEAYNRRKDVEAKWICTEGWHEVKITDYEVTRVGRGGRVDFTVQDNRGRKLNLRFRTSIPVLRGGELLRFAQAAMNWDQYAGNPIAIAETATYRKLIGRRVAILVARNSRGYHQAVDWAFTDKNSSQPTNPPHGA